MKNLRVCLVGFGYWGPNLARNIVSSDFFELAFVFEPDSNKHKKIAKLYPSARILHSKEELISIESSIDVGVIATPTASHFELAKFFLEMNCHVWIEKPFTRNFLEAKELLNLADKRNLKIFVDHTYWYNPTISEIKSIRSQIGDITYINSTRSNFGIIQNDSSVIWDLAVHDLSIINYIVDTKPISLICVASSPFPEIQRSIATLILNYETFACTVHVNWLSPFKVRDFILGGTAKSIYFDDTKTDDKLRVYLQSIENLPKYSENDIRQFEYKYGDILVPDISNQEALAEAFKQFALYINDDLEPASSGTKAAEIIRILSAADASINQNGALVHLNDFMVN